MSTLASLVLAGVLKVTASTMDYRIIPSPLPPIRTLFYEIPTYANTLSKSRAVIINGSYNG